jgi:hypothetical protein
VTENPAYRSEFEVSKDTHRICVVDRTDDKVLSAELLGSLIRDLVVMVSLNDIQIFTLGLDPVSDGEEFGGFGHCGKGDFVLAAFKDALENVQSKVHGLVWKPGIVDVGIADCAERGIVNGSIKCFDTVGIRGLAIHSVLLEKCRLDCMGYHNLEMGAIDWQRSWNCHVFKLGIAVCGSGVNGIAPMAVRKRPGCHDGTRWQSNLWMV